MWMIKNIKNKVEKLMYWLKELINELVDKVKVNEVNGI